MVSVERLNQLLALRERYESLLDEYYERKGEALRGNNARPAQELIDEPVILCLSCGNLMSVTPGEHFCCCGNKITVTTDVSTGDAWTDPGAIVGTFNVEAEKPVLVIAHDNNVRAGRNVAVLPNKALQWKRASEELTRIEDELDEIRAKLESSVKILEEVYLEKEPLTSVTTGCEIKPGTPEYKEYARKAGELRQWIRENFGV